MAWGYQNALLYTIHIHNSEGPGGEHGVGGSDINIHIDINVDIDIHIIINKNIEYYIR